MLSRAVTFPSDPASIWRALTEPEALAEWFGAEVELDLRPGGQVRVGPTDDGSGERSGIVEDVEAGRRLRFTWWPDEDGADRSEVSYDLEADEDGGTTLTVTERRVPGPTATLAAGADRPASAVETSAVETSAVETSAVETSVGEACASRAATAGPIGAASFARPGREDTSPRAVPAPLRWSAGDQRRFEAWAGAALSAVGAGR